MPDKRLNHIFSMERNISLWLKPEYDIIDSGMSLDDMAEGVYQRHLTIEDNEEPEKYWCFSYSDIGEIWGDLPEDKEAKVCDFIQEAGKVALWHQK